MASNNLQNSPSNPTLAEETVHPVGFVTSTMTQIVIVVAHARIVRMEQQILEADHTEGDTPTEEREKKRFDQNHSRLIK
jgi:hypothetical protein